MKFGLFVLWLTAGIGTAQIAPPRIGFVLDANRSLRPLLGFTGNWVLGDSVGENILSGAGSGASGMFQTDSSIFVTDSQGQVIFSVDADASRGPASFAFDAGGQPALAWVRSAGLLAWRTDHLEPMLANMDALGGGVLSLSAPAADRVRFAVQRVAGLWQVDLSTSDGSLLSQAALAAITAPVLLQPDGSILYADNTALIVRAADGTERRLELGFEIADIRQIGAAWLQVSERGSSRQFAVRITPGYERTSQLPEAPACCAN